MQHVEQGLNEWHGIPPPQSGLLKFNGSVCRIYRSIMFMLAYKKMFFSDTNGLELIIISHTILNDDIQLGVLAQTYQILLTSVEQKNYLILPTNIWALRPFLPQWIKPKSTDTLWHNTGLITERSTNPKRVQCHFPPSKRQVSTILQIFIKVGSIGTHSYKPWIKVRNLANSTSRPFRSLMLFISI